MIEAILVGVLTQAAVLVLHEVVRYLRERIVLTV